MMYIQFKNLSAIALIILTMEANAACDVNAAIGPDADIDVDLTTSDIDMGNFTRPDSGDGSKEVTVSTDGVQTLPSNLDTYSNGASTNAAEAHVTGEPGCKFQITTSNIGADISFITFEGNNGHTLSAGDTGVLDASGGFDFSIGATLDISDSGGAGIIGDNFNITVTYID